MENSMVLEKGFDEMQAKVLRNKGKRGALSLEMMGIIAIIAILVMSGLYYLNIMMRDTKINDAIAALQLLNTKVSEMYMNESNYNGLTDKIFIESGNAPSSLINSTRTALKSPWGTMQLQPANSDKSFSVTFNNVPNDVCQKFGSVVKNSTAWQSLKVNGSTWDITTMTGQNLVTFLNGACKGTSPNYDTMVFTSRQQ